MQTSYQGMATMPAILRRMIPRIGFSRRDGNGDPVLGDLEAPARLLYNQAPGAGWWCAPPSGAGPPSAFFALLSAASRLSAMSKERDNDSVQA
jgi:hypothetical protein